MGLLAMDVAQKEFLTLPRDTSALDAARIMKSKGTQFVIVSTPGSLEGIVTEWDYISKIVAEGKNPAKIKVADIMSSNLITVDANDPIESRPTNDQSQDQKSSRSQGDRSLRSDHGKQHAGIAESWSIMKG